MANKTWTYDEITVMAEKKIKRIMSMAEKENDPRVARHIRQMAYGVYDGWYGLTVGWQKDGDDGRLKSLTDGPQ